jgi:adenosylhomocysteine nucleosidase
MPKIGMAIIAALDREITALTRGCRPVHHHLAGCPFAFYELDTIVLIAGGIGIEAARRAAEAAIAIYHPETLHSVGFAGALQHQLRVGDIFSPSLVIDSRDGSRITLDGGEGTLLTYPHVAGVRQKAKLAQAYAAQAIDMEAAAVAAAACLHGVGFRATKVISDGFNFEMPNLTPFIDSQGHLRIASFSAHVMLRPWLWPRTFSLARSSHHAAKALTDYLNLHYLMNNAIAAKTI